MKTQPVTFAAMTDLHLDIMHDGMMRIPLTVSPTTGRELRTQRTVTALRLKRSSQICNLLFPMQIQSMQSSRWMKTVFR